MRRGLLVATLIIVAFSAGLLTDRYINIRRKPTAYNLPCIRKAADFPSTAHLKCGEDLKCEPPYDYGDAGFAGEVNGVELLTCCPRGYTAKVVRDDAGVATGVICKPS